MNNQKGSRKIKRVHYDIETSPNIGIFWRAGFDQHISHDSIIQERKIVTIAWKFEDEKEVHALWWNHQMDDKEMIRKFLLVLDEADEAVAHFGDRFDFPWIKTRALFHGLNPVPLLKTIDTKAWASKYFYFNSNKLDYLAKFFGSSGKLHTDLQLWKDVCLKNDRNKLAYMVKYNKKDVIELEFVYKKLAPWVKPKTHVGVLTGLGKWTCPRTGSTNVKKSKTRVTSGGSISHQMQNLDDGSYYSISDSTFREYVNSKKTLNGR